jgi:D-alanine transaminase
MSDAALHVVMREAIRREGYGFVERTFSVAEAGSAREAFLTSTVVDLLPVVRIDGNPVGNGHPGPLSRKLRKAYLVHAVTAGSAA